MLMVTFVCRLEVGMGISEVDHTEEPCLHQEAQRSVDGGKGDVRRSLQLRPQFSGLEMAFHGEGLAGHALPCFGNVKPARPQEPSELAYPILDVHLFNSMVHAPSCQRSRFAPIMRLMSLEELRREVEAVRREWVEAMPMRGGPEEVEELRVRFLGRKGRITALIGRMKDVSPEQRAQAGKLLNALKEEVSRGLEERRYALEKGQAEKRLLAESYDLTLPGQWRPTGTLHPLTQVRLEIEDIFLRLGFTVAAGPEVETDYHNFEALNIPADHPARDEWDSFYVDKGLLLRTHTSPVQIRVMKQQRPPVRIICPGKCYRRDNPDATHAQLFHQVELLWVEEGLSMAHLKWVIGEFVGAFFGAEYEMRFAADYFPFTEPSAQVHIRRRAGAPEGRQQGGWLEIMGAGMVDPLVLEEVGYDSEMYTGFAFGLGVERMAMLRWGIEDIRLFLQNDPRFLSQF